MTERRIKIVVDPLGTPKIEAEGFSGEGCAEATKAIESALAGDGNIERVMKPEWFETEPAEQETQQLTW